MKVKLEEMRKAFAVVDAVRSTDMESSQFVRLRQDGPKLSLAMTGMMWGECDVKCVTEGSPKWTTYADRRALKPFLDTAQTEDIEFRFDKTLLTIKAGQKLEVAPHAAISGYETWTPKGTFDLADGQLLAMKTGVSYLPAVPGSEHMEACYFGKDCLMFTDSILFMAVLGEGTKSEFFLPAEVARFVASNGGKVASDGKGVGAALNGGYVYQPLSAELDRYPKEPAAKLISEARKSKPVAKMKASDALAVLNAASQFLLDKAEAARVENAKNGLLLTVDMNAGKFQRTIPCSGAPTLAAPVNWPVKRVTPWLEYAVAAKPDAELEYSKQDNSSSLRFVDGKKTNVLLWADL